jgi:hypothetical protein
MLSPGACDLNGSIVAVVSDKGVGDELWVYLATDPNDGVTGIAYMQTTASATVPLVAESFSKAEALKPIARRLAAITGATFTLCVFRCRENLDIIEPPP